MADGNSPQTLEQRVRALEDRIQIEDVIVAAALFIDEDDFDRGKSMYTDDATIDIGDAMGDDASAMSREEFWGRLHGMLKGMYINWHQVTNFCVDVQGDSATTISEVRAVHQVDQGDGVVGHFGATYYHKLVRTSAGWRIKHQKAKLRWMEGDHTLLTRAKEQVAAGKIKTDADRAYRRPEGVST